MKISRGMTLRQFIQVNKKELIPQVGKESFDWQLKWAQQEEKESLESPLAHFYFLFMRSGEKERSSSFLLAHKEELIKKFGKEAIDHILHPKRKKEK